MSDEITPCELLTAYAKAVGGIAIAAGRIGITAITFSRWMRGETKLGVGGVTFGSRPGSRHRNGGLSFKRFHSVLCKLANETEEDVCKIFGVPAETIQNPPQATLKASERQRGVLREQKRAEKRAVARREFAAEMHPRRRVEHDFDTDIHRDDLQTFFVEMLDEASGERRCRGIRLTEIGREVLELHFGLNGRREHTIEEIAEKRGCTDKCISAHIRYAIWKVRRTECVRRLAAQMGQTIDYDASCDIIRSRESAAERWKQQLEEWREQRTGS